MKDFVLCSKCGREYDRTKGECPFCDPDNPAFEPAKFPNDDEEEEEERQKEA